MGDYTIVGPEGEGVWDGRSGSFVCDAPVSSWAGLRGRTEDVKGVGGRSGGVSEPRDGDWDWEGVEVKVKVWGGICIGVMFLLSSFYCYFKFFVDLYKRLGLVSAYQESIFVQHAFTFSLKDSFPWLRLQIMVMKKEDEYGK